MPTSIRMTGETRDKLVKIAEMLLHSTRSYALRAAVDAYHKQLCAKKEGK